MSTSIKNLRQLAARDVKDHTAIFDSYVVLGRDIDYLAIKFGLDPENIVNLLEGYGKKFHARMMQIFLQSRMLPERKLRQRLSGVNRRKDPSFPIRFGSTRKRNGLCFRKIRITILPDAAGWEICHGP